MSAWYECCGGRFPEALGKYGCPLCCGEKVAQYREEAAPVAAGKIAIIGDAILFLGDSLEVLPLLGEGVDSVVTDPPYGLSKEPDMAEVLRHWLAGDDYQHRGAGFMGKAWDSFVPGPSIWRECLRVLKPGGHQLAFFGTRTQDMGTLAIRLAGFEVRDSLAWVYGSGMPHGHNLKGEWEGWSTALKPALEPITMARKPLKGTVADNVQAHGCGALNIDGCRVPFADEQDERESKDKNQHGNFGSGARNNAIYGKDTNDRTNYDAVGRWPTNLIHDGCDEVMGAFPGNSSRFFYCGKATKKDREEGNNHPTVKPTDLMAYLCRLVTPPAGVVLDPFMGSGTTGKAALREGFRFIGIERDPYYFQIACRRIAQAQGLTFQPETEAQYAEQA